MLTRRQSSSKLQVQTDNVIMPVNQRLDREQDQHPLSTVSNQIVRTGLLPLELNEETFSFSPIGILQKSEHNVKQVPVSVKDYTLNNSNVLNKKLHGCVKEHINVEMKANKNLVLKFSTARMNMQRQVLQTF